MLDSMETQMLDAKCRAFRLVWTGFLALLVMVYATSLILVRIEWTSDFYALISILLGFPVVSAVLVGVAALIFKGFILARLSSSGDVGARTYNSKTHVLLAASEYFSTMLLGILMSASIAMLGFFAFMLDVSPGTFRSFGTVAFLMMVMHYPKRAALEELGIKEKRRMMGYPGD